ncbi:hypothetical protein JOC36_000954 [Weissella uvarum]|uniref:hypothetical protein n=1 Tax=Weissella uvarum TaxID=1479233 RepID=UPI0019601CE9|nr:hypothetical protein [Weissella uvarum]MBM7617397.1 hypothetical protein [Weissella uvarum]MCM0595719.1 hypothetical protein [Weissella uvarum]
MPTTPQVEAIDTKTRVDSFFMWQDMMMVFAQSFYIDCQLIIKDIPDDPSEYLRRLKKFSSQADDYGERWVHMAELLELIGLEDDVDILREWYKQVVKVTRLVDEYIQRLSQVQNLEKQRTSDVRMYEFIDCVRPLSITFVEAQAQVMKDIKKDFLATLDRSPIEIRLLDNIRTQFIQVFDGFDENKIAFYAVENQGAFKGFDGVYANMTLLIKSLYDTLKGRMMNEFEIVDDETLIQQLAMLIGYLKGIDELLLEIPKQQTYSIQGLESGAFGTDIFELVQRINEQLVIVGQSRQNILDRITELMAE